MSQRRIPAFLILALVVSSASPALAIYTPNPAGRWAPARFSLLGDFQYNSKELDNGVGELDGYGLFVRPSFSPIRNMSVYGRFGVQGSDATDAGFGGGVGFQYAFEIPAAPEWAIGGAVDLHYWHADFEHSDSSIRWFEFQLAPAVSYDVRQAPGLVPYAGLLFDFVDARGSLRQDDPVGILIGTTYEIAAHVRLEAQARFISENGVLLSAGYTF